MSTMIAGTHTKKKAPPGVFVATTIIVFFCTFSAAESIGFVPYYIDGSTPASQSLTTSGSEDLALSDLPQLGELIVQNDPQARQVAPVASTIYPKRIVISSVNIDLAVQNPKTVDIKALETYLVNGPARYAHSATLGEPGNVVIFAHSSNLPTVRNKMYKAFNGISKTSPGDIITITGSDGLDYIYSVIEVERENVNDGAKISLQADKKMLTLVTCDTLTSKSTRFVLTAEFVGTAN